MGMTNKQYQGFIRLLKTLMEKVVRQADESTKEEIIQDVKAITETLQGMLEDGD